MTGPGGAGGTTGGAALPPELPLQATRQHNKDKCATALEIYGYTRQSYISRDAAAPCTGRNCDLFAVKRSCGKMYSDPIYSRYASVFALLNSVTADIAELPGLVYQSHLVSYGPLCRLVHESYPLNPWQRFNGKVNVNARRFPF